MHISACIVFSMIIIINLDVNGTSNLIKNSKPNNSL